MSDASPRPLPQAIVSTHYTAVNSGYRVAEEMNIDAPASPQGDSTRWRRWLCAPQTRP